jgi:CRP/FNR family transcriptional regulator, cyclic AMP receptor protein
MFSALVPMFNIEQFRAWLLWHRIGVKSKQLTQLPARTKPRTPYGMEIIENCLSCSYRGERLFCNLPEASIMALSAITSSALYPKGANLFVEGQPARGIFILCSGKAKLSTSSADGKTLILRIAEPGEVLGLPASVTGTCYELTAEVVEPAQSKFISRSAFLAFLKDNGEAALRVAQQLGEAYHLVIAEMRTICLSHSSGGKLARFLLEWAASVPQGNRVKLTLTHEEIGQMIGSARETVTRLLTNFRRNQWLQIRGSTLMISNKAALEGIVNGAPCPSWPRERGECHVCAQTVDVLEERRRSGIQAQD